MKSALLLELLTVAALASFEIYAAIPAGFAFGLSPWLVFLSSVTGGLAGVFIVAFLGDRIRRFFGKKKKEDNKPKTGLVYRIWNKYGIIGLGLLGTFTVGAPASLAVGLGFSAPMKKMMVWCCIGVISRCVVFTLVGYYGFQLF
jgi:membrane protein YqaA with SNARE-associated domain